MIEWIIANIFNLPVNWNVFIIFALDKNKKKLGVQDRIFMASDYNGALKPGFSDSVEVPVRLHGMKMKSMKCSVYSER